ncbi:CPBP family intramembrane glutamic endopeptidase [[Eubacterium] cellulosolvens]
MTPIRAPPKLNETTYGQKSSQKGQTKKPHASKKTQTYKRAKKVMKIKAKSAPTSNTTSQEFGPPPARSSEHPPGYPYPYPYPNQYPPQYTYPYPPPQPYPYQHPHLSQYPYPTPPPPQQQPKQPPVPPTATGYPPPVPPKMDPEFQSREKDEGLIEDHARPLSHDYPPSTAQPYPYPFPPSYQYPYPYPYPAPYFSPYQLKPPIYKKMSEIPLVLIFLVCLTVYWIPYILSNFIAAPFLWFGDDVAEIAIGGILCSMTIILMLFLRRNLDRPTWEDYGLSTKNLGSNLFLAVKLVFVIYAVESLVVYLAQAIGISFEGGVGEVDLVFIISAVIIAPIFEETVYRMNAATLLARRLPIIWVAFITSTWFIAKHVPMWHFDNGYGLPAVSIIVAVDVPLWILVTYYFLKRNCIWIPVLVHVFNNGSIVLFHYLPSDPGMVLDYVFIGLGIAFIFIYGLPGIYRFYKEKIETKKFQITQKSYYYLGLSLVLASLFLVTSEALVSLLYFETTGPTDELLPTGFIICSLIGILFIILGIITIVYVYVNKNIYYVKG